MYNANLGIRKYSQSFAFAKLHANFAHTWQMQIKLSSSDAMSPSHSKMLKNFRTDAEMTELLLFKY